MTRPRSGWAAPSVTVPQGWRTGPLSLPVTAVLAGVWAAVVGLVLTVIPTLIIWIFAAGQSSSGTAIRVGVDVWLVANGVPLVAANTGWTLLPTAWVVLPACCLWAAGRWVAHRAAVADLRSVAIASSLTAAGYAAVALLAGLFATLTAAAPHLGWAVLRTGVLAFAVAGLAQVYTARLARPWWARTWDRLQFGLGAFGVLAAGSLVLLILVGLASSGHVVGQMSYLDPGLVGAVALFMIWLGYLPAIVLWVLSYGLGAGIRLGSETITPWAGGTAPMPNLPGLSLLPTTDHVWFLAVWVIPLAAGVILARGVARSAPGDRQTMIRRGVVALAVVGVAAGFWWWIATGDLGSGRMSYIGPTIWVVPVLVGGVGLGALLWVATVVGRRHWRRRATIDLSDRAEPAAPTDASGEEPVAAGRPDRSGPPEQTVTAAGEPSP